MSAAYMGEVIRTKKLYIYSLEYDYKKQKYVVQMDYLFAIGQGSHEIVKGWWS